MFETMVQLVMGDHMGGRTFSPPVALLLARRRFVFHRGRRPR